jgi:hypothetical protein
MADKQKLYMGALGHNYERFMDTSEFEAETATIRQLHGNETDGCNVSRFLDHKHGNNPAPS